MGDHGDAGLVRALLRNAEYGSGVIVRKSQGSEACGAKRWRRLPLSRSDHAPQVGAGVRHAREGPSRLFSGIRGLAHPNIVERTAQFGRRWRGASEVSILGTGTALCGLLLTQAPCGGTGEVSTGGAEGQSTLRPVFARHSFGWRRRSSRDRRRTGTSSRGLRCVRRFAHSTAYGSSASQKYFPDRSASADGHLRPARFRARARGGVRGA